MMVLVFLYGKDDKSAGFDADAAPWARTAADLHAGCDPGVAQGTYAEATGSDGV